MEKTPQENPKILKEKRWQEDKIIVDNITDRLGIHIDEGIKDTVIAFRLLGFETTQSHEGNMDRVAYPYIDISTSKSHENYEHRRETYKTQEYQDIENQIRSIRKEINTLQESDIEIFQLLEEKENVLFDQLHALTLEGKMYKIEMVHDQELKELEIQVRKENFETTKNLQLIIDEFYQNKVKNGVSITMTNAPFGITRIVNQDFELQEKEQNEAAKKERLESFQREMNDFTDFLKEKYFGDKQ